MEELKTRTGFNVLKVAQIPFDFLLPEVQNQLDGRAVFFDGDEGLGEAIYSGDIFEAIACEQNEMGDAAPSFMKLSPEALNQINAIAEDMGEIEYIMITKI